MLTMAAKGVMVRRAATRPAPRALRERSKGRLILVIGGAASGKSQAALELAGNAGPRALVATGQALDREMAERIRRHRAARSADWATAEVPLEVAEWFRTYGGRYRTIVLDCLTLWLSNSQGARGTGPRALAKVEELLRAIRATKARVIVVTNELGLGLVPVNASVRAFRDLAGRINQQVATEADEVYFVVSGQRLRIK